LKAIVAAVAGRRKYWTLASVASAPESALRLDSRFGWLPPWLTDEFPFWNFRDFRIWLPNVVFDLSGWFRPGRLGLCQDRRNGSPGLSQAGRIVRFGLATR